MVSTRGLRYKFSEGERVLCYEPDPTKAKVLYDSKVLEVIESKDKRGRRTVEYLIHFQGWNSSWDRCVSEDFVLKDTEENRQLQRDLAEKSQLQLGAYLYRRERKKGSTSNSGAGAAKRVRHGFSDDGSTSSTPPDDGEIGDTDSSSGSGSSAQPQSPPNPHAGRASITLQSALRDRLTFDYHLVVKRGRLARLPASPCVAQILEGFVRWFARAGAWRTPARRHEPPPRPDMLDVTCRLNLLREVADGLRVYFDFVLRSHLLYRRERQQYADLCGQFADDREIKSSPDDEKENYSQEELMMLMELRSPRLPDYSHLPPDPDDHYEEDMQDDDQNNDDEERSETHDKKPESLCEESSSQGRESTKQEKPESRSGNVARRLRSHKSAVSQSENDAPSTSADHKTFETLSSSVGSSGSSVSEAWASRRPAAPAPPTPATTRTPLSQLLDKVGKWQIVPRENTEHLPCRVYGAIHLARLFVKLPDFLNATQMPDLKLKLILKHIDVFVHYLEDHSEWFGEMYYINDGISRSH
ncbi:protein male-specific lethal-3 isoform X4 [Aricia agestis]|uniref:protein male-specific lethal-3 isoform X4 n=1 Tax=Aricia agestis TaxID=91739 RepID=UPI001C2062FF|nr:protein male-specific lethal-3 isoform X4 [Aricia agestis]